MGKLTTKTINRLQPRDKPYEQADGGGMYVTVRPNGSKSFNLRYRFGGKPRNYTIGPTALGLDEARKLAREALVLLARGVDPGVEKLERKTAQAAATGPGAPRDLVEFVVGEFIERYARPQTKDWKEAQRLLEKEVVDAWRGRRLSEISRSDVHDLLDKIIDRGAPIAANRVFAQLRKLCNWAVERGIISHSPCDKLTKPVSEKGRARDRILDDAELASVWRSAGRLGFPFGPIVRLLMLVGARRSEIADISWDELDLNARLLVIPAARSKNGRRHDVHLSAQAIAILQSLPRFTRRKGEMDFVFSSGATPPTGFSRAKTRLDRALREDGAATDFVIHDIRRSVASGMARIGVQLPVIEKCLNHVSGSFSGIVSVYQRHSFADEMRDAFDRWGAHVEAIVAGVAAKEAPPVVVAATVADDASKEAESDVAELAAERPQW